MRQIRKAAQTVQNVVTYTVVVATENPGLLLVPGMTANVRIVADSRESVLKVPNAALRYRPPGVAAAKDGDVPAPGAGAGGSGGGGGGDPQARRQRLVEELKLDAAQQARLDEIYAELRARMAELRDVPEADRRTRGERLRGDVRQKINAMLNPEQQKKYAEIVAAETGRGGGSSGRVYVDDAGKPQEVALRLGLTDGNATEVVGGDVDEGIEVIVGNATPATPASARVRRAPRVCRSSGPAPEWHPLRSSRSATSPRSTRWAKPRCTRSTACRSTSPRASSSPSWVRPARASRRS